MLHEFEPTMKCCHRIINSEMRMAEVSLERCDARFTQREFPQSNNQRQSICTFCNKSFRSKADKLRHERIHTGEKPFNCGFCGKTFSQKVNAETHEATHTGEKQYKCSYCIKAFMFERTH